MGRITDELKERIEEHRGHWPRLAQLAGVGYTTITGFMAKDPRTEKIYIQTAEKLLDGLDLIDKERTL